MTVKWQFTRVNENGVKSTALIGRMRLMRQGRAKKMSNRKQKLAEVKNTNTVDDVVSWLWDDVPLPEKAAGRSGQMTSSDLFKMLRMYERGASAK